LVADACEAPLDCFAAWHIDPDRRAGRRRTTRVDQCQPDIAAITAMLAANPSAAVKLAPAAVVPPAWEGTAELEWIGSRGECRQQVAWFGELARRPASRAATVLSRECLPQTILGQPWLSVPTAEAIGRWVYEPHAAVLAARLTGVLAAQYGLAAVSRGVAYLPGDRAVSDPALSAFEVTDVLPFDMKKLKALFRARRIGRLEVKKRGVAQSPEAVGKALKVRGDQCAVLLLARIGARVAAILARRVRPAV
jgi:hypothetical protein